MNLYEITEQTLEIENILAGLDEESANCEAVVTALQDALTAHKDALGEKLEKYVHVIRNYEALAEARKAEAARLTAGAKVAENKAARLKEAILNVCTALELSKVQAGLFTVSIAQNGGKAPLNVTADPSELPEQYRKVEYKPNNDAIREALEAGESLPFASIGERGRGVRIK
jgi:hypothetical protein